MRSDQKEPTAQSIRDEKRPPQLTNAEIESLKQETVESARLMREMLEAKNKE